MQKVVEFLQKNPVQYLATSEEMERQNAVHSCSVLSRTESFGSVLTTQRMFTRIC